MHVYKFVCRVTIATILRLNFIEERIKYKNIEEKINCLINNDLYFS